MSKIRRGEKLVAPGKLILGETGEQGGQKEENDISRHKCQTPAGRVLLTDLPRPHCYSRSQSHLSQR
jgi:hypothetical protein